MFKKIVLAYDGSEGAAIALQRTEELAGDGAEVLILAVGRIPEYAETVSAVEEAKEQAGRHHNRTVGDAAEALRVRISYTTIHSPLDGVVSQVTAQEGETIVAGLQVANLVTVLDTARLEMWVYVDETDVGQVKPGMDFSPRNRRGKRPISLFMSCLPRSRIRSSVVWLAMTCSAL